MLKNYAGTRPRIKKWRAAAAERGYKTLRNGALGSGSGETHFLMPGNNCKL